VHHHANDEQQAHPPEQRRHGMQKRGVIVHLLLPEIDLHVAGQMSDEITEQDYARYGHDSFLPDRRLIEPDGFVQVAIDRDGTHI
jgi:hypothetical protein